MMEITNRDRRVCQPPESIPAGADARVAGWRADLLRVLLFGLVLALAAGSARAAPLIAGCCDSITSDPSYLDLVWDVYSWPTDPDPYEPQPRRERLPLQRRPEQAGELSGDE